MRVVALAPQPTSVLTAALARRGFDPVRAEAAANGLQTVAFLFENLSDDIREATSLASREHGLDCLTGDGWILVVGSLARVAGLARPGFSILPPPIAESLGNQLRHLSESPSTWQTARGPVTLDEPVVVGILNVTPDSFSDGGRYLNPEAAVVHAEEMVASGADLLDVGGESTRPGAGEGVSAEEEWGRLSPIISKLTKGFNDIKISVDTVKAETARRALQEGVAVVNDVSGFRLDSEMADVCASAGAGVVLMHSRGTVGEMASYTHADYDDLVIEVCEELLECVDRAVSGGVSNEQIVLDPGLGFGKRPAQNYSLLRQLRSFVSLGYPIMVGPSRKRFLREVSGESAESADDATAAACVSAHQNGAALFRVHDATKTRAALRIARSIRG